MIELIFAVHPLAGNALHDGTVRFAHLDDVSVPFAMPTA